MKQGKNPTRKQKIRISKKRLNPENWVVIEDGKDGMKIKNKETGTIKIIK